MHSTLRSASRLAVAALGLAFSTLADVRLHPLFSDHAVLQQGIAVPVWGWADPGESVTVEFGGQKVQAKADEHRRWKVSLRPLKATDQPGVLRVTGKNSLEINDVVVGEVWICSGQSNMEWPMSRSFQPDGDIQNSANPRIRLFTVQKNRAVRPLDDLKNPKEVWAASGADAVRDFSAVGYYFGRQLEQDLKVPVGLIHTSWGGSPAEVWMSDDVLRQDHLYFRDILAPYPAQRRQYLNQLIAWQKEKDAAAAKNEPFTKGAPWPGWTPSELYNGMIAPLLPYAIRGAIWYQGESNAGRAWQYRTLFADMITNWRRDWGQGDFPFLAVQLAPWDKNKKRSLGEITATPGESDWAELREAQNHVAKTLPNVGVAVITDVGDKDDIHPTKKGPVGERLAKLSLKVAYGRRGVVAGPVFQAVGREGGKVLLQFGDVGDGLKTLDGGAVTGFQVAGEDHVWHWATGQISGRNGVVLTCPEVAKPAAIRYGWSDFPVVNLANSAGYPASPFRTDDWPAITAKK